MRGHFAQYDWWFEAAHPRSRPGVFRVKENVGSIRTHFTRKETARGGKASRFSCVSHADFTSALTLASVLLLRRKGTLDDQNKNS